MWLFTKFGFFSVVQNSFAQGNPNEFFAIRARVKEDMVNLVNILADTAVTIKEFPEADYRFRILVSARQLAFLMEHFVAEINYTNFKNTIAVTKGQRDKLDAYHQVWAVMEHLQEN